MTLVLYTTYKKNIYCLKDDTNLRTICAFSYQSWNGNFRIQINVFKIVDSLSQVPCHAKIHFKILDSGMPNFNSCLSQRSKSWVSSHLASTLANFRPVRLSSLCASIGKEKKKKIVCVMSLDPSCARAVVVVILLKFWEDRERWYDPPSSSRENKVDRCNHVCFSLVMLSLSLSHLPPNIICVFFFAAHRSGPLFHPSWHAF